MNRTSPMFALAAYAALRLQMVPDYAMIAEIILYRYEGCFKNKELAVSLQSNASVQVLSINYRMGLAPSKHIDDDGLFCLQQWLPHGARPLQEDCTVLQALLWAAVQSGAQDMLRSANGYSRLMECKECIYGFQGIFRQCAAPFFHFANFHVLLGISEAPRLSWTAFPFLFFSFLFFFSLLFTCTIRLVPEHWQYELSMSAATTPEAQADKTLVDSRATWPLCACLMSTGPLW